MNNLLQSFREISPYLSIILLLLAMLLGYIIKKLKEKISGKMAPTTVIIGDSEEKEMRDLYDEVDGTGKPKHAYKIALNGQEGVYQDLDILLPQLLLWYNTKKVKYVDFRFCIVSNSRPAKGSFTVLVAPVSSTITPGPKYERARLTKSDIGVDARGVDLGDLHP